MTVTLFSWGYWGWGNATERLVEAIDAAERARGFCPSIFVDTRLRRQGRAKGFVGNAFRDLVGESRYRWMQDLGNLAIATGRGGIRIKNPAAVAELLELAVRAADQRRRLIFYCACEFPWFNGMMNCHRRLVADLLLAHAEKVGRPISVVEWPGGEAIEARLEVDRKLFRAVMGGRKGIPFSSSRLNDFAGLPWGSVVAVECEGGGTIGHLLVRPPRFAASKTGAGFWYLPVIGARCHQEIVTRARRAMAKNAWTRRAQIAVSGSKHGERIF
jgi:hypothetical protein